jgi:F-type H+-transporting ATPase subunit epsilon
MELSSYNKYAQITARALRSSLKEEHRLAAEKRGLTQLRYQQWENGQGGRQVCVLNPIRHQFSHLLSDRFE